MLHQYPISLSLFFFWTLTFLSLICKTIWPIGSLVTPVLQEFSGCRVYLKWRIYNSFEEDGFHSYKQSFYDMTCGHGANYIHQMCLQQMGVSIPEITDSLLFSTHLLVMSMKHHIKYLMHLWFLHFRGNCENEICWNRLIKKKIEVNKIRSREDMRFIFF